MDPRDIRKLKLNYGDPIEIVYRGCGTSKSTQLAYFSELNNNILVAGNTIHEHNVIFGLQEYRANCITGVVKLKRGR